jgi:hypothetical protein
MLNISTEREKGLKVNMYWGIRYRFTCVTFSLNNLYLHPFLLSIVPVSFGMLVNVQVLFCKHLGANLAKDCIGLFLAQDGGLLTVALYSSGHKRGCCPPQPCHTC